jgi:macrolide-specific efflux system membrane fusion protein
VNILRFLVKWASRHKLVSFLLIFIITGGFIFWRYSQKQSQGILTAPLEQGSIIESVYGIGTVMANRIFRITPGVSYSVANLYVSEGDKVKKGARLVGSDTNNFRAPFDGTITSLPVKVGDNVFPGTPILTLVDLNDRYLLVSLEQQGALRVEPGQKTKISFDTIREKNYEGVVKAVYSNDNNFLARIDIGSLPPQILPGMTADVAIEIQEHKNVLLVPVAALGQGDSVWIKNKNSLPKKVSIKTGIIDKAWAEMIQGPLQSGDRLLIKEKTP